MFSNITSVVSRGMLRLLVGPPSTFGDYLSAIRAGKFDCSVDDRIYPITGVPPTAVLRSQEASVYYFRSEFKEGLNESIDVVARRARRPLRILFTNGEPILIEKDLISYGAPIAANEAQQSRLLLVAIKSHIPWRLIEPQVEK